MKIVKSFVVILYNVNVEKDHHVPNHLINDGCHLFINGILVGVK